MEPTSWLIEHNLTVTVLAGISSTGSQGTCNFLCTGFNIANTTTFAIVFTPANALPPPPTSTLPPPPNSQPPPTNPYLPLPTIPPPAYQLPKPSPPPPPPATSLTPYLNVTFVFSGTATYNSIFLSRLADSMFLLLLICAGSKWHGLKRWLCCTRFTTALSTGASVPVQNVIILSLDTSPGRRLQQAGYVVSAQVWCIPVHSPD